MSQALTSHGWGLDYHSLHRVRPRIRSCHGLGHPGILLALSFFAFNIFNSIIGDIPNSKTWLLQVWLFLPFPCRHVKGSVKFTRLGVHGSSGKMQTLHTHLLEIVCNLKQKYTGPVSNTGSDRSQNRLISEFRDRAVLRNVTLEKL